MEKIKRLLQRYYYRYSGKKRYAKLIRANRAFWKSYFKGHQPDSKSIVLAEANQGLYTYGRLVLANVLARQKHARVAYIHYGFNAILDPLRKSFSSSCIDLDLRDLCEGYEQEIEEEVKALKEQVDGPEALLGLKYKGIQVGDLVYDSALRTGHWKARIRYIDQDVVQKLRQLVRIYYGLKEVQRKYDVRANFHAHSAGVKSFSHRFFSTQGIESYTGNAGTGATIRKHRSFNGVRLPRTSDFPRDIFMSIWEDDAAREGLLQNAERFIEERFRGGQKDLGSQRAFSEEKKIYKEQDAFIREYGLADGKPCVFVMLHSFNDYPHHYSGDLFTDYYRWFIETLKIVRRNPEVNWVFKEHPSSKFYPDDANLEGIFEVLEDPHVLFLNKEEDFNAASLKNVADGIVTCMGTAGLEFSCFGVPGVLAGENHYSGYGICHEPVDIPSYEELLLKLSRDNPLRPPTEKDQEKARLLFYLIYHFCLGSSPSNHFIVPYTTHEQRLSFSKHEKEWQEEMIGELEWSEKNKAFLRRLEDFINDPNREIFLTKQDILDHAG